MPKTIKEATNEAPPSRSGPRKLTQDGFAGDQALSACAEGYHMASLWEIFNTSDLRYDTTLGVTQEDSGSAPPSNRNGWSAWVVVAVSVAPGFANSGTWASANPAYSGTRIALTPLWDGASVSTSPWLSQTTPCSLAPVWSVQD